MICTLNSGTGSLQAEHCPDHPVINIMKEVLPRVTGGRSVSHPLTTHCVAETLHILAALFPARWKDCLVQSKLVDVHLIIVIPFIIFTPSFSICRGVHYRVFLYVLNCLQLVCLLL